MTDDFSFFESRPKVYTEIDLRDRIPSAPSLRCNVRVLSYAEIMDAHAKAMEHLSETYKDRDPGKDIRETVIGAFQIARALYRIKPEHSPIKGEVPVFANGKAVLALPAYELSSLFHLLEEVVSKAADVKVDMSADELTDLTKSLALCSRSDQLTFGMLSKFGRVEVMELLIRASMLMHPTIEPMGSAPAVDDAP